jgi:hypothetical protein
MRGIVLRLRAYLFPSLCNPNIPFCARVSQWDVVPILDFKPKESTVYISSWRRAAGAHDFPG